LRVERASLDSDFNTETFDSPITDNRCSGYESRESRRTAAVHWQGNATRLNRLEFDRSRQSDERSVQPNATPDSSIL
jgi:hypothetical protein